MILNESLDYMDLEGQVVSRITIDEYSAKMGSDKDIVTVTFIVRSQLAATDLTIWFERGYDFVLDASEGEGELSPNKWVVFVEMERRAKVPNRICKLLSDLETLTGLKLKDWTIEVEGEEYDADEEVLHQAIICNPNEYKEARASDEQINEFRELAGLDTKRQVVDDEYTRNLKAMAGM